MVAPGCVYSHIIESNGETTPKKNRIYTSSL